MGISALEDEDMTAQNRYVYSGPKRNSVKRSSTRKLSTGMIRYIEKYSKNSGLTEFVDFNNNLNKTDIKINYELTNKDPQIQTISDQSDSDSSQKKD